MSVFVKQKNIWVKIGENMKKLKLLSAIFVVVFMICTTTVLATDVSINYNNFPFNVTDKNNTGFSIVINETGYFGSTYTVEYSAGDITASKKIKTVKGRNNFSISFDGLKNGVYSFNAAVKKSDGTVLKEINTTIGVVDSYTTKPMEKFSRVSMGTHLIFDNQTDKKEIEFLNKIGVFTNREEIYWGTVEYKGVWNFTKPDAFMGVLKDNGMETIIILDYSNQKYVVTDKFGNPASDKTAPRTAEEMAAFTRYVKEVLTRYPQIKAVEIWNEPNWGFWQPEKDAIDYSAMVKAVSSAVREVNEDIKIYCGSLVYSGHKEFLNEMIEEGVLPYVDVISSHPYSFPYGSDRVLEGKLSEIDGIISNNGGFKEHIVTEIGLPTSTGDRGTTEEWQASELVKSYVYGDDAGIGITSWYNFRNKGTDPAEEEHNYGIINRDYTPKKAVIALANLTEKLNGSIYLGSVEVESGLNVYIYLQNGKITAVAWSKNGEKTINLECGYAEDIYGNVTEKKVSTEPVYLFEVNKNILWQAMSEELSKIYSKANDKDNVNQWVGKVNGNITANEVRDILTEHITNAEELIDSMYKNDRLATMTELEIYRKSLEKWAGIYAVLEGTPIDVTLPEIKIEKTKNPDTSAVYTYAKEKNDCFETVKRFEDFNGKSNALAYYSALTYVYSSWAEKIYSIEAKKKVTDVFLYPVQYMISAEKGEKTDIDVVAVNREKETVTFNVCMSDETGKCVVKSDSLTLLPGESKNVLLSWQVPAYKNIGDKKYFLSAEYGTDTISKRGINVSITGDDVVYDCFGALDFEDYSKLSVTDKYESVTYIENGQGNQSVHSGKGALYINGNGAIKITSPAVLGNVNPKDGDFIDGEYYLKVMEQKPTDWKQPIIRLYGILGTEKVLLCETENLNTYSVWETKRFAWNRLTLKNTGVPYCDGMELMCEITVGIGTNGGLKFMLDDISYYSSVNEKGDGYITAYGVPEIDKWTVFDGSFESAPNGLVPGSWGAYTPGNDSTLHSFEISKDIVYDGEASIEISRGGSMWNIIKDTSGFVGENVGGYYMLYVPETAELKYNYPRVWVECVYNDKTYTLAESPKNASQYQVKTGWNKIPIVSTGISVPKNASRINLMLESPNIIENEVVNREYAACYYLDDINVGSLTDGIYLSDNSSADEKSIKAVITNTDRYERKEGNLVAAAYCNGKLVSCEILQISMRGMSARKQQSIMIEIPAPQEETDKIKLMFLNDDMITPICEVICP